MLSSCLVEAHVGEHPKAFFGVVLLFGHLLCLKQQAVRLPVVRLHGSLHRAAEEAVDGIIGGPQAMLMAAKEYKNKEEMSFHGTTGSGHGVVAAAAPGMAAQQAADGEI